jgi:ketosteroid isomerase-like protein
VRAFLAASSIADSSALEALTTEDFTMVRPLAAAMQSPALATSSRIARSLPRAKALRLFTNVANVTEGGRLEILIHTLTAEDNRVAVEAESRAVNGQNGRIYNNHYHFLFRVRDGRACELREYQDTLHAYDVWEAPWSAQGVDECGLEGGLEPPDDVERRAIWPRR